MKTALLLAVGLVGCGDNAVVDPGFDAPRDQPSADAQIEDPDAMTVDHAPVLIAPAALVEDAGFRVAGQLEATDADGDPITYEISEPANGAIQVGAATGQFIYTSSPDFAGIEQLEARATANGVTVTAPLSIELRAVELFGDWAATNIKHFDGTTNYTCSDTTVPLDVEPFGNIERVTVRLNLSCTAGQQALFTDHQATLELPARFPGRVAAALDTIELSVEPDTVPQQYLLRQTITGSKSKTWTATLRR